MKVVEPGHIYDLDDGQQITFVKHHKGVLLWNGATNEELLEILINRTEYLNEKFPCIENEAALHHLAGALRWFNERTEKRVAQGLETKDQPHVS